MQSKICGIALVGLISVAAACTSSPLPAAKAAGVAHDQQCDDTENGLALLRSTTVIRIDPVYSHVMTADNSEERVNGAKLLVRPPDGLTADQMARVLQCHSANVLLGQVSPSAIANDPYWLPNSWVDIHVAPENGNFAVTLTADSVTDNLRVLSRANRYGDAHQLASEPPIQ
jgi:hypothetical protein